MTRLESRGGNLMSAVHGIDGGVRQRLTARFGSGVAAWLNELPEMLTSLAQRWNCEVGASIQRGSVSAAFWCRLPADGRDAVLKASPDRARLAFEAAALRACHTVHTPSVIAFDDQVGALLIEAIEPGAPLDAYFRYPAVECVAELLRALHDGAISAPFPTLAQRVTDLFDSSAKLYTRHPELTRLIPPGLYGRGQVLATALARHDAPTMLLHGDLTPANILDGGPERGLVAIDPSPCVGDPAFDAIDLILWQADDVEMIEARCERLAAATGLDARRHLDWCVAFAAMAALEAASNGGGRSPRVRALQALAARA
jgi:streptomycin 6-kinase